MPNPLDTTSIYNPYTSALFAGALAGITVDLSLHPIDTLKTRMQSSAGFYPSGGFRGIYAGVGSALIGSAPGAALFFVTYESIKTHLRSLHDTNNQLADVTASKAVFGSILLSEPVEHMLAASAGEVAACAVRVPTEVVKQRTQAAQQPSSMAALKFILAQRTNLGVIGVWRELYRGWSITVMREVPFTLIQFPLWEAMKGWRRQQTGHGSISALDSGVFGSLAGAVAAGVTTPLDVLKTRMMLVKERQAAASVVTQILRDSGPRALFAGIAPRIVWISAGGAIFLGSYQWGYNTMSGVT